MCLQTHCVFTDRVGAFSDAEFDATVLSTAKSHASVTKVMETATRCVQWERKQRPRINEVLDVLIEAKNLEDPTNQPFDTTSPEEVA